MPDTDQQPLTALPAPRRVSRKVAFLVITAVCALVAVGIVVVPLLLDDSSGDGVESIAGPLASPAARTVPYVAFQNAAGGGAPPGARSPRRSHPAGDGHAASLPAPRHRRRARALSDGGGSHAPHGLQGPDLRPRFQGAAHAQPGWASEPCPRLAERPLRLCHRFSLGPLVRHQRPVLDQHDAARSDDRPQAVRPREALDHEETGSRSGRSTSTTGA